jgi:lipopolysaccharide transport system permease protein
MIVFAIPPRAVMLVVIPGVALLTLNLAWLGLVLAIFSSRFRDVPIMIGTLLQVGIFATPIMWPASVLGPNHFIADLNPVYHLIELVRAPLLNELPAALSWQVGAGLAIGGWLLAALCFRMASGRIVYWL